MKKITLVKDKGRVIVDIDDRLHFEEILLMLTELIEKLRKRHIIKN